MLDEMSLFHNYSIMNPTPMPLIPLHFLLKNGDGYVDEALLFLLLQIIFDYVILVGSYFLRGLRACGEAGRSKLLNLSYAII